MYTNSKHCATIHSCLQIILLRATPEINTILSRYTNRLIPTQAKYFFLLNCKEALHNSQWKEGNKFSFLQDAKFIETDFYMSSGPVCFPSLLCLQSRSLLRISEFQ